MSALPQRIAAASLLVLLCPLLGLLGLAVRLSSPGPILYRARRMGAGRAFTLYKFRTMDPDSTRHGSAVTASGDPRVTRIGRFLRRAKLDELPQLWNVARGDMLLVGPRPEDPRYVDLTNPLHREVFAVRPGITGPTALAYRDEETSLAAGAFTIADADGRAEVTADDIDRAYRDQILPAKVAMDAEYLRTRSTLGDLRILGRTIAQVLRRLGPTSGSVRRVRGP